MQFVAAAASVAESRLIVTMASSAREATAFHDVLALHDGAADTEEWRCHSLASTS